MEDYLKDIEARVEYEIESRINKEVYEKAPIIIHQAFCNEFAKLATANPKTIMNDLTGGKIILDAINLLEDLYPKLKTK